MYIHIQHIAYVHNYTYVATYTIHTKLFAHVSEYNYSKVAQSLTSQSTVHWLTSTSTSHINITPVTLSGTVIEGYNTTYVAKYAINFVIT